VGDEANGVYLNPDTRMPLASVVKVIHLAAYAEAVGEGRLDPTTPVTLAELERYYLPFTDVGAHPAAVSEVELIGGVFGEPPSVLLEDVPRMMVRHSSNAATDYLHFTLGQATIEQTAIDLGLGLQTAPCPFLGQFLIWGNHTRVGNNNDAIQALIDDPAAYSVEVMRLAELYANDAGFRSAEVAWRRRGRRQGLGSQMLASESLNAQGSARDYARLMATIAQDNLSSPGANAIVRRYLEWPMEIAVNQELFSSYGYKGGLLPGILTGVYYAYPADGSAPLVVALFYRDLPGSTYREWRRSFTHDELGRWLVMDPGAIPTLREALAEVEQPA
jgi:hypothetical protein